MPGLNDHPPFTITKAQFAKCFPHASQALIDKFYEPLLKAMERYEIDNKLRVSAFLATVAHESGELRYVEELASGEAYENRADLGNTQPGDGKKFKGRGLIQLTGRDNYKLLGFALNHDFINNPEHLELPGAASLSAGWFWHVKGLNRLADIEAFEKIQKKVNGTNKNTGKPNGWGDRVNHYNRIRQVLGIEA